MRYTEQELMLCTYAALYDLADIGRLTFICQIKGRSVKSVRIKVWAVKKIVEYYRGLRPNSPPLPPHLYEVDSEYLRWIEPKAQMPRTELRERSLQCLVVQGHL